MIAEKLTIEKQNSEESKKSKTSLEGSVIVASVGDIIKLYGKSGSIAGFVSEYDNEVIKLSHENPFKKSFGPSHRTNYPHLNGQGRKNFGRGDKSYIIETFQYYETLKKLEDSREGEHIRFINSNFNQLDVIIGDIIMLLSPTIEIAGYFIGFKDNKIKLSHEDIFKKPPGIDDNYGRKNFGRGDKEYYLKGFEKYQILHARTNDIKE